MIVVLPSLLVPEYIIVIIMAVCDMKIIFVNIIDDKINEFMPTIII